jgi:OmcA/MtrC family decaheme c-type cytochrome
MNVTYDFVPEQLPGPDFTFDTSRDIVTTGACNECHGRLGSPLGAASFHGGSRYTAEACTVCHTTTLGDGLVELAPMVHKIHAAKVIGADTAEPLDFSEVTYPQDLRNCTKCHAGTDGSNWNTRPSRTACGSCHDTVNFDTGENHGVGGIGGQQPDNSLCAFCHTPAVIEENHLTENSTPNNPDVPEGLALFEYVIDEVTVNENNEAVVTFHINKDGAPLDLTVIPPDGFSGGPSFLVAYALPQGAVEEPADYNNLGKSAAQPASISLTCLREPVPASCTAGLAGTLTGTPDSYTAVLTAAPFPAGAKMRAVSLQGYFTQVGAGEGGADVGRHTYSVVKEVTGDVVRRGVVDEAKCLACHEIIEGHGGNRVNNPQVCVLCHNPNLSSSGRTADATKTDPAELDKIAAAGYDPTKPLTWPEATNNFKDLIHGIHAAAIRNSPYEFVRNRLNGLYFDWSEVTFPGIPSNCETCHIPGTYGAELPANVLVTTDVTTDGLNATQAAVTAARASVPNGTDQINSPTVAACYMCHDADQSVAHMTQNGGVIDNTRAEALGE